MWQKCANYPWQTKSNGHVRFFSGKLDRIQVQKLFRKLFKAVEGLSIIDVNVIMDKVSSKYANDDEEIYSQLCFEWFKRAPRHVRQVKQIITCLEEMELHGLVAPLVVITPGARKLACEEIIRVSNESNQKEVLREIARFLKLQREIECKNLAIDLLLKL